MNGQIANIALVAFVVAFIIACIIWTVNEFQRHGGA